MKLVAIIAPDFAPSSLPPATRVRFFTKHLPEFGWEPIVLTVDPKHYEAAVDPENESLLPGALRVIRTSAFSARWTRRFGVGDIGMRSLWQHWRAIERLCRERKIDLIFIPVPPYVPMILGRLAYERFGVPYVIDYIDPWVTEYYWKLPKAQRPPKWPAAYWLARILEPFALKKVSHLTGVSRGTTQGVIDSYSWLSLVNSSDIPYGVEGDDFEYLRQHSYHNSVFDADDGLLHASYVGACPPPMYPALRALFAAVKRGMSHDSHRFGRLRLHFVGTSYAGNGSNRILALAEEAGIASVVSERSQRVSYLESLQVMIDSHALVLIGSDEAHYTASKVFPYILARKPVLALLHEASSAAEVLQETGACQPVTFNGDGFRDEITGKILARLESLLDLDSQKEPDVPVNVLDRYSARQMTRRLALAFDQVSSVEPGDVATTVNGQP